MKTARFVRVTLLFTRLRVYSFTNLVYSFTTPHFFLLKLRLPAAEGVEPLFAVAGNALGHLLGSEKTQGVALAVEEIGVADDALFDRFGEEIDGRQGELEGADVGRAQTRAGVALADARQRLVALSAENARAERAVH